jgi:hypothetical protein
MSIGIEVGFYVNRSISKIVNGQPLVKAPKSRSSKRFVKMPDFYMDELAKYYRIWKKEKLMLGDAGKVGTTNTFFTVALENPITIPPLLQSGRK